MNATKKPMPKSTRIQLWIGIPVLILFILGAIATAREEEPKTERSPPLPAGTRIVTEADYGEDWPLTTQRATLRCDSDMVWVEASGSAYTLNGHAEMWLASKHPDLTIRDLDEIWRPDPNLPEFKVSISALTWDGLDMCK